MKKFLLLISFKFLLISYVSVDKSNYLEYHIKYNKIEELIVSEHFNEAQIAFEKLFEEYEVKFVKDYVVAAQVNLLIDKKKNGLKYLKESTKRGIKIECLKSINLLEEKLNLNDWQILETHKADARKIYLSGIDLKLNQEFHKRYQEEQDARSHPKYKEVVYSNFNRIKELLEEDKFVGEQRIGIDDQKYAKSISDCGLGNSKVIVTLLHYDYPISEIGEEKLIKAITKGELHPREYAYIYNYEVNKISKLYKKSKKKYENLPDYKFNFPFGKKIEDIRRVNKDRMKFGICNYQIDLKKKALIKKYGLKLDFNYR